MKNILLSLFLMTCSGLSAQMVYKTMRRLPDTGQTTSYTTTFGEDADYNLHVPAYELNGDGTVTDTVTGLMWQHADGGEMSLESAMQYCDTLTIGGYTDWRLPDCHELFSIFHHDKTNPALDTMYFSKTSAEYWWSSQIQINDQNKIWVTNSGGGIGNHPKTETISAGGSKRFHVRAVRDVIIPALISEHFVVNPDETLTDLLTFLTWQPGPDADSMTWEDALNFADTLTYGGFSDWRLPNIKELQSINDEKLVQPSVNTDFFSGVITGRYWSSTSLPNQPAKAWYLDTHFGITTYAVKSSRQMVICVRNADFPSALTAGHAGNEEFVIYPNPAKEQCFIKFPVPATIGLRMFNAQGKEVYNREPAWGSKSIIDTNEFSRGVYVIEIKTETSVFIRKIFLL